jgi:hypothetical protein
MGKNSLLKIACAIFLGCVAPAEASGFRAGTLTCLSDPRIGLIVGSSQSMRCTFQMRNQPRRYIYDGTIRRLGLDLGLTPASSLAWIVVARNSHVGRGTLRGHYVGASGSVAFGPGFGANVLIGGSRRTVVLQPLSVERQIGISLTAGVAALTLR